MAAGGAPAEIVTVRRRASFAGHEAVIATGVCVAVIFVTLSAASLVTLEHVKSVWLAAPGSITPRGALALLRPIDAAIALAGILAFAATVLLEWRAHGLRRLLAADSPAALLLAMTAAILWFAHAHIAPGLIVVGDAGSHVARINHLAMALRDGASPYWDNYFFAGGTLMQFTGPVFHWMATAATLLTGDATDGAKWITVSGRFVAAWFMFAWLRRIGLARPAAALGALFYAGSFFFTYLLSIRGTLPQIVNIAALPALLYCVECIIARREILTPGWAGLVLTATLFIGGHQSTAVVAALLLLPWVILRMQMAGWPRPAVISFLIAGPAVIVATAFFIVPFLAEKSWTAENFSAAFVNFTPPSAPQEFAFLRWGAFGLGAQYSSYLGLSVVLCAIAGALALSRRSPSRPLAPAWLAMIALLVLSQTITALYVRMAVFSVLFLTAAAAIGVEALLRRYPQRDWLPAAIFVIFLLDTGALAVQPWDRPDLRAIEQEGEAIAARAGDQRVLEVIETPTGPGISIGPDSSPLHYARVQMLYGPHKMDATRAHNAMAAVLKLAEQDLLKTHGFGTETRDLLSLYDVGWIVGWNGAKPGLPATVPDTLSDAALGAYLRIPTATPVLASGRLVQTEMPESIQGWPLWTINFTHPNPGFVDPRPVVVDLYRRMDVDLATRQAQQILMPDIPDAPAWHIPPGPPPDVKLIDHTVRPDSVHLAVELDRPGYIRIAHPFYPTVAVTLNGARIEPARDIFTMLVIPAAAGVNSIDIAAHPAPLRVASFWITMASIAALILLLLILAGRDALRPRAS
jgi:hypothetical protein